MEGRQQTWKEDKSNGRKIRAMELIMVKKCELIMGWRDQELIMVEKCEPIMGWHDQEPIMVEQYNYVYIY